jgi:hypothetical protein
MGEVQRQQERMKHFRLSRLSPSPAGPFIVESKERAKVVEAQLMLLQPIRRKMLATI